LIDRNIKPLRKTTRGKLHKGIIHNWKNLGSHREIIVDKP
jgi:hypothetical protein